MLTPPEPDPDLDPFRGGVATLSRSGEVMGYAATQVSTFWAPLSFSLRRRWRVWLLVVWADGHRERLAEDYPPWTVVADMISGRFVWDEDDDHQGTYAIQWLPEDARQAMLEQLAIMPEDF